MKLILIGFFVFILGCNSKGKGSSGGNNSPDFSKLYPDCFSPIVGNPVLSKGDLFSNATWNDPHVLKSGSQFIMYASADENFDQNIRIFRLVSQTGESWSLSPSVPVLEKGAGGTDWDRKSVETPAVIRFNGTWYMFYTGYPVSQSDPTTYRIGYATSSDGISWTKRGILLAPTDPAGAPNMDFNQFVVAEPAPVVFQNKIHLYFTALGANASVGTTLQTIGLITSDDGVTWTAPQRVLEPDQTQYPRSSNWKGYSTPNAIAMNDQVHLFFNVVTDSPFEQVRIHHAYSSNGLNGWVQDSSSIFDRSEFHPWASESLRSPSVLLDGRNLRLYFAGNGDTSSFPNVLLGIGLARCNL